MCIRDRPYLLFLLVFAKLGEAVRLAPGADASQKLLGLSEGFSLAFQSMWPGAALDWLVGLCGAVIVRLAVYLKGKDAKKYRKNVEYGSARWGNKTDIAPFMDPKPENNIILTQTEGLMMSGRPKNPAHARNKNVLVVGGSGSGKTRFFIKPDVYKRQAYGLHILAGDFLRESEFNLRSLATNTGPDSIAIMGKNHIWLADALSAYYPSGELYRMAAMTEYPGTRAFLFHTERKEDGRLYGDVLMTDLDTLRQDIERNTLYPYGVSMEYRDGTKAEAGIEKWEAMELCEKDALKNWSYLYAPEQVTEWQHFYLDRFSQWKAQAFSYMPQDLEELLNVEYMEAAQNPDMDMYRIPLGTAKQDVYKRQDTLFPDCTE